MIHPVKYPKQTSWKIIYGKYEGFQKKAVEFLSTEVGKYLMRDGDWYRIFVVPCFQEGAEIEQNAIVVGTYQDSPTVRKFVEEAELDGKDYLVKVVVNPDNEDCRVVIITAKDERNLFYGAIAFADNYPTDCAPGHGGLKIPQWIYDFKMPEYKLAEKSQIATRGVWSWAQPIGDYRKYIREMARMKFNQIVLWNEYMPLNAKEVVDFAHGYGIEVLWGYSWGWANGCKHTSLEDDYLQGVKENALREYREYYSKTGCDGIYFQSFTEMSKEYIGDKLIARVVTDLVNETVAEFYKEYPDIKIQFGLHATSVKNRLEEIARVDKRVEIVWEDCGTFPYGYTPRVPSEEAFQETLEFTRKILALRPGAPTGLIFKGMMTVDWEMFEHQTGPYVLGENSTAVQKRDAEMRRPIWQMFEAGWLQYGGYALRLIREIIKLTNGDVNLAIVNEDGGGLPLPVALFSEMLWNPDKEYGEIMRKVSERQSVIEYQ
ncbi:MAG: hypothetical protein IKA88_06650 [Clostridia bacterium]|nr:hypothetical protein [Clostridia bacterium]